MNPALQRDHILSHAEKLRNIVGADLHETVAAATCERAAELAGKTVTRRGDSSKRSLDQRLDRILTSRTWGFPLMGVMLMAVFWLTITGANYPSSVLSTLLLDRLYGWLHAVALQAGVPAWLSGFSLDGVYLATAWVVSVMLPPMAIFFPLFTLLEDFGYLPRVAFNLDRLFKGAGAHGKQALTMMMGYGCNAAGIISTRIIDSPRERLIAIITNNFSICNGRWPTLILMGTIFIGASAPPAMASLVAAASVVSVVVLGIIVTIAVSALLSRTLLVGEASAFSLELPPYRPPRVLQTVYTSMIDRTLIVLWRAVVMAAPAGAVIWLASNVSIGGTSIAAILSHALDPVGLAIGLNGIIILAYIVALPANEIVIPTVLMLTLTLGAGSVGGVSAEAGVMVALDGPQVHAVLTQLGGWTTLTAVNLMLFSLLHNPCSTTLLTIWQETRSVKWTLTSAFLPLVLALIVTGSVTAAVHLLSRLTGA